jgi:hypothetical protein
MTLFQIVVILLLLLANIGIYKNLIPLARQTPQPAVPQKPAEPIEEEPSSPPRRRASAPVEKFNEVRKQHPPEGI